MPGISRHNGAMRSISAAFRMTGPPVAGFLLGSAYGLTLMLLGEASRKTELAPGPYMIPGALTVSSLSTTV